MSLPGDNSERPYPPTATRAAPSSGPLAASQRSRNHPSTLSARSPQNAAPRMDGSSRSARRSSWGVTMIDGVRGSARSDRFVAEFAGPNPDDLVDRRDPHLAVADLPGTGSDDHDLGDLIGDLVRNDRLDPD